MALKKPASVENDAFKSAKWDEVVAGRSFNETDAPILSLLCQWYKIVAQAQEELESFDNQTAYPSENGDLKPLPQISTLKTASSEIRALNKQLGIGEEEQRQTVETGTSKLEIIQNRRKARAKKTA